MNEKEWQAAIGPHILEVEKRIAELAPDKDPARLREAIQALIAGSMAYTAEDCIAKMRRLDARMMRITAGGQIMAAVVIGFYGAPWWAAFCWGLSGGWLLVESFKTASPPERNTTQR